MNRNNLFMYKFIFEINVHGSGQEIDDATVGTIIE